MAMEEGYLGFLNFAELERYINSACECDLDTFEDIKPFQPASKSRDCDRYEFSNSCYSNWTLYPPNPRCPGMPPLQRIQPAFTEELHYFNVKKCYEKVQCRKNKESKQRVSGATINLMVTTDSPIAKVEVFVERLPNAAALFGDCNGKVPLKIKMEKIVYADNYQRHCQYFSVDLDSVYHNPVSGAPVYKLSTVDSERRNQFWLVAYIVYANSHKSEPFYSDAFLLKSKRSAKSSPY